MAITSWPYVAQDTTDVEYSRLYREGVDDGVADSLGGSGLQPFADGSGMVVKMRTGSAVARGYMMYSTEIESITIDPSSPTLQRVDRLVLRLNLSAVEGTPRLAPFILKGDPAPVGQAGAKPLTKTSTGIYDLLIGQITIEPGVNSIAADKVVDVRSFIGQTVGAWDASWKRPESPRKYKMGFNEETGGFEYWNGTAWKALNDHSHSLTSSQITGVLPISKGGTGAQSRAGIRSAIGLYVQTAAPSNPQSDDVWIKKS